MLRDKIIHIRVTQKELDIILKGMEKTGVVSMSQYIRLMVKNGIIINVDMSELNEVIRLMGINSNNLNQYAKKANENGSIYKKDIDHLKEQQDEIYNQLKVIINELIRIKI